ncbi:MAG: DMT family transporter, partial [Aristaeellaceae bacterium]
AMVVLDIAAPVLLMNGLTRTSSANAALLNNFEIVATSLIALAVFHERIDRRLWCAIGVVTVASMLLSVEDAGSLTFSSGSLLVLLACVCWGFENNCTRMMSHGDPLYIVAIKGLGSGAGAAVVAWLSRETMPEWRLIPLAMLLGFVSYGLSVYCYVYAQRSLGAARTSAYYAIAPFVGVGISFLMFREMPGPLFLIALALMLWGSWLLSVEPRKQKKR